jgi:hypothetical protein
VADDRPSGRHRMPAALPAWLPDRPTIEAWLRQWWISVVSGAVILVTAVTVLVVIVSRDTGRPADAAQGVPATATPPDPPVAEEPAPAATTSTPTPSPTPRRTPAGPVDRLAAFVRTVQQLVASGDLDRRAARDLQRTAATIAVAIQEGRTERAVDRLRDLDERLRELREDDKLSRAGFEALDVLQPIIATLR